MPDTMPKLMVFDLDGTLVDSAPDIAAAVNRLLAARGLAALSQPAVAAMVGDGLHKLIERVFAAHGRLPDAAAADEYLADYEANVLVETALFPGMAAALAELSAHGWQLAVCTNKPQVAARKLLEALGIAEMFTAIGGGDSFAARKPDPLHLRETVRLAGGDPKRAVMIGDHRNDVQAALGCDMAALFAGWGYGPAEMAAGARAVCASPAALPGLAAGLGL